VCRIGTAFCGILILSLASASAAEFPVRKAGLWEITIAGDHPIKVRQCSDPASDQAMEQAGIGVPDCGKRDVEKSGNTITVISVCTSARKTTVSHMVITGSLDSEYTMTMTTQGSGRSVEPSMKLSGRWLGPCAAGQKPGDVIMPNGTKINILDNLPKPNLAKSNLAEPMNAAAR
jgi:Protein of unknown function (DUF3617)